MESIGKLLAGLYNQFEDSEKLHAYNERHGIRSANILTIFDDDTAALLLNFISPRIEGKTVVEIGGGIGLFSLHMAAIAKRVICIEANPLWAAAFGEVLLRHKPRNASYILGAADEFVGFIKADIAVYLTHSDAAAMGLVAAQFAPEVIDVYGVVMKEYPEHFEAGLAAARQMATFEQNF